MIGVFDSGSGGITILKTLRERFPDRDFLYLGDHANAPYGHRDNRQIVNLTKAGVDALMRRGCSLVILACNTAAAVALRDLQQNWLETAHSGNRILGVLVPMVEVVTGVPWHQERGGEHAASNRTIVLFATRKTIESRSYHDEVEKRAPEITLVDKACPGLVDAIEGGAGKAPIAGLIDGYVAEVMSGAKPDAVILGCTHFPLVRHRFETALGASVPIYSQPDIVAESLSDYLTRHPGLVGSGNGRLQLLTTGNAHDVNRLSSFLPDGYRQFKSLSCA